MATRGFVVVTTKPLIPLKKVYVSGGINSVAKNKPRFSALLKTWAFHVLIKILHLKHQKVAQYLLDYAYQK
jgi:hypothetical protein